MAPLQRMSVLVSGEKKERFSLAESWLPRCLAVATQGKASPFKLKCFIWPEVLLLEKNRHLVLPFAGTGSVLKSLHRCQAWPEGLAWIEVLRYIFYIETETESDEKAYCKTLKRIVFKGVLLHACQLNGTLLTYESSQLSPHKYFVIEELSFWVFD